VESKQIIIFLVGGAIIAVLLVVFAIILVKVLRPARLKAATEGRAALHRLAPELAHLPEAEQDAIVRRTRKIVLIVALVLLAAVIAAAFSIPNLADIVNESRRTGVVLGLVGIAIVLIPTILLQKALLRRQARKRG
jgi:hypothetical protein